MGPIPYRYEFAETVPGGTEDPAGGFRPALNPDPIASGSTCNHSQRIQARPEPAIDATEMLSNLIGYDKRRTGPRIADPLQTRFFSCFQASKAAV